MFRTWLKASAACAFLATTAARADIAVKPLLSVSAEERYDDDILFRDQAQNPIGAELMTKVTPKGGVNLKDRTFEFDGWYAPDFQLRHFSGVFRVDHRAGMKVEKELSPLFRVHGEGNLWRVADPTSLPRMGVARTMSPVLYGNAEAGLESRFTRLLSLDTTYRFEGARIYQSGFPASQVHEPSADLWYRVSPRSSLGAEYRFQYFMYGDRRALGSSPAALYRYRLTKEMTFTAHLGAVWYQALGGGAGTGVSPRVHLQLDRNVRGLHVGVQAGQDVLGATGFSEAVWAQYAGLFSELRISQPLSIYANLYGYRNGDAPGTQADWLGQAHAPSQGYGVGGGAEWRFNRTLTMQVQLDRVAQVGTFGPDGNLSRNIAAVRLVVTPW